MADITGKTEISGVAIEYDINPMAPEVTVAASYGSATESVTIVPPNTSQSVSLSTQNTTTQTTIDVTVTVDWTSSKLSYNVNLQSSTVVGW